MIRKNVAIIVQKLKGGGAERTAANLSMLLSSRYNVFLIVFDGTDLRDDARTSLDNGARYVLTVGTENGSHSDFLSN